MPGRYPLHALVEANRQLVSKHILHWFARIEEAYLFYASNGRAYSLTKTEASLIARDLQHAMDAAYDKAPWTRSDPRVLSLFVISGLFYLAIAWQNLWALAGLGLALVGMVVWYSWMTDGRPKHALREVRRQATARLVEKGRDSVPQGLSSKHRFRFVWHYLTNVLNVAILGLAAWVVSGDDWISRLKLLQFYIVFYAVAATALYALTKMQEERREAELSDMLGNREGHPRHERLKRQSIEGGYGA